MSTIQIFSSYSGLITIKRSFWPENGSMIVLSEDAFDLDSFLSEMSNYIENLYTVFEEHYGCGEGSFIEGYELDNHIPGCDDIDDPFDEERSIKIDAVSKLKSELEERPNLKWLEHVFDDHIVVGCTEDVTVGYYIDRIRKLRKEQQQPPEPERNERDEEFSYSEDEDY